MNDEHKCPNANMRIFLYEGEPRLCLFAVGNIQANTEIRYSYGFDSDGLFPWRKRVSESILTPISVVVTHRERLHYCLAPAPVISQLRKTTC